jgi:hypothetical protein
MGKQTITEQDRDFVSPIGSERESASTDLGFVHHVIVNQRCEMNHLYDNGDGNMRLIDRAQGPRRQRHEGWAQVFALAIERIIGVGSDVRVKGVHFFAKAIAYRFQKGFNWIDDLFPGAGGV